LLKWARFHGCPWDASSKCVEGQELGGWPALMS